MSLKKLNDKGTKRAVNLRDVPIGEDGLTNWVYKQLLIILGKKNCSIKRHKRLMHPDKKRKYSVRGDSYPGGRITINSARSVHKDRDEELSTLIHELCHILFPTVRERYVAQLEGLLFKKFTLKQKGVLKTFLPKHEHKVRTKKEHVSPV